MDRAALRKVLVLAVLMGALAAAGCDSETTPTLPTTTSAGEGGETTTQAPETTAPPDTTEAPGTTVAAGEDGSDTAIIIAVLLGVLGIGALLVAIFGRRGKESAPVAAPVDSKTRAQEGYAAARWLYDNMTENLAIWRGNAQFEGTTDTGATAATSHADTWNHLPGRLDQATDALYGLEATASDEHTAAAARAAVNGLNGVRSALDARAQAQFNYRQVEAGQGESTELDQARDRAQRSSQNLTSSRATLASALDNLATIA